MNQQAGKQVYHKFKHNHRSHWCFTFSTYPWQNLIISPLLLLTLPPGSSKYPVPLQFIRLLFWLKQHFNFLKPTGIWSHHYFSSTTLQLESDISAFMVQKQNDAVPTCKLPCPCFICRSMALKCRAPSYYIDLNLYKARKANV